MIKSFILKENEKENRIMTYKKFMHIYLIVQGQHTAWSVQQQNIKKNLTLQNFVKINLEGKNPYQNN